MLSSEEKRLKHNKYNREWAKKHRERYRKYLNDWRKKRLDWYFSLKKGKKCKFCGESHPACLDYHHENPRTKKGSIRRLVVSTADNKIVLKEISKCILVCANCHRKIHWTGEMV